jgi:hypothetical protein
MREHYVPQRDPINTEHIIALVRAEIARRLECGHAMQGNSLEAETYWLTHNSACEFQGVVSAIAGMIEGAVLMRGSGTQFEKEYTF